MIARRMLIQAARDDFGLFAQLMFNAINPTIKLEMNWHIIVIATMLDEAKFCLQQYHQIVTMPPRSLKSFLISEAFPAYLLGHDPSTKILCATYGEKLSEELASHTAQIMRSAIYQEIFPKTRIDKDTRLHLTTTAGGGRLATSIGGAVTGFGGDWIIVDDPMNASDAHSKNARDAVKAFFDGTLSSRVNNETTARFIVVMQRLHEDDLVGHLKAKGGWNELKLQAKATESINVDDGSRLGHTVKVDDLLHEKRLPQAVLDRKQREMGSANFQAQYQQDPVPASGNIVRRDWLSYYSGYIPRSEDTQIVLSLDTATKTNPEHDYSVCTIWNCRPDAHFLLDVWRAKVEYPQLKASIIDLYHRYGGTHLLIEEHGNGASLLQELNHQGLPAIACHPTKNKESRLISATSHIESGQMRLPSEATWLAAFETELLSFPNGKHDDQVDSVSQYFSWVRDRGSQSLVVHSLRHEEDITPETLMDILAARPRW